MRDPVKCLPAVCFSLALLGVSAELAHADITISCGRSVLRLSEKAVPLSLVLAADKTDCLDRIRREPFAEVQAADGTWNAANRLSQRGDALELGFLGVDTTLALTVETPPDWIALRVSAVGGTRPKAVRFVMLNSAINETVGTRLNLGWNSARALCVMAASPLTETCVMDYTPVTLEATVAAVGRGEGGVNPRVRLSAMARDVPGAKMEGAAAVIIACPTPEFKKVAQGAAQAHGLRDLFAQPQTGEAYLDALGRAIRAGQPQEKWPTVKGYVDAGVTRLRSLRDDMIPGELGGIGVWPRHPREGREIEGIQLDEIEYLLCRSVAYDCPVSLQAGGGELARNPLAPDILRLAKAYEAARLAHRFTEADQAPMREPGKEFTLLQRQGFSPVLVPVRPVTCGNSRDTHAMVGSFKGGSVATFWHAVGSARITLDLSPFVVRVADFDDQRVVAQKTAADQLVLPVTTRRLTLLCPTLDAATLEQKIKNSLSTNAPAVYK
jgi:hypothetical protein